MKRNLKEEISHIYSLYVKREKIFQFSFSIFTFQSFSKLKIGLMVKLANFRDGCNGFPIFVTYLNMLIVIKKKN